MKMGKHIIGQHRIKTTPKIAQKEIPSQPNQKICQWFEKSAHGDRYAFRRFYLLTNAAAYGYVCTILRDGKSAEELLIQAYRTLFNGRMECTNPSMPLLAFFQMLSSMAQSQADKAGLCPGYVNSLSFDRISDSTDRLLLQTAFEVLPTVHLQLLILTSCCPVSMEELCCLFHMQPMDIQKTREIAVKRLLPYLEEE